MTNYYDDVYIKDKCSIIGSTKYNPIVKENVNKYVDDYYMNEKTIEMAESRYQRYTINYLNRKSTKWDFSVPNISISHFSFQK